MVDLLARPPLGGSQPVTIGDVTLREVVFDHITSVAALKGQTQAVSKALKTSVGAEFPEPNRTTGKASARIVWSGPRQAMVLGPHPGEIAGAAQSDQSDAWVVVELSGNGVTDVLARLVPIDLRASLFKQGHAARTLVGHMNAILFRTGGDKIVVMVYRSMAETLLHELQTAMSGVAARQV